MRPSTAIRLSLFAIPVILGSACSSTPSDPGSGAAAESGSEGAAAVFSPDRAWNHLEALAAIGPRAAGTPGAEKARRYISDELRLLDLDVDRQVSTISFEGEAAGEPIEVVNLAATIPGASSDLIVLAAPYDSAYHATYEYRGVNDGGSGAALLLEVARILVDRPLPYTVHFIFLDAESPLGRGDEKDADTRHIGSTVAANRMAQDRSLARVRLLLLVNRVSDADLRIARDRFSHRTYRDVIWRTAAELGHEEAFAPGSSFDAPLAGHRSFNDAGMRRTVAIIDPHFGAGELPEAGEHSEDDTLERSSPESLAVVGEVVLASLDTIGAWLVKIDRFSNEVAPALEVEPESEVDPAPEVAPAPEFEPDPAPEVTPAPEGDTGIDLAPESQPGDSDDSHGESEPRNEPESESAGDSGGASEAASEAAPGEAPAP